MISGKNRGKRRRNRKLVIILTLLFFISPSAFAQDYGAQQFQQNFSIRGRISGTVIVLGSPSDAANIQKLADMVIAESERTYDLLDASNPSSEVAKLNTSGGKAKVSWQVADAFKAAKKVSQWSRGAFDVIWAGGDYNSVSVDEKENTVEFKKPNMEARLDPIIEGFLADYMINLIYQANMRNAMVRVGNVFRGIGQSLHGPWKIQVQEDSAAYARHALNVTVSNTGIATISATDFRNKPLMDYRSKSNISPKGKGATIVMNEAALAQGIAYAVFVLGPTEGMNLLTNIGGVRGLIVDTNGKFLRTPGM